MLNETDAIPQTQIDAARKKMGWEMFGQLVNMDPLIVSKRQPDGTYNFSAELCYYSEDDGDKWAIATYTETLDGQHILTDISFVG